MHIYLNSAALYGVYLMLTSAKVLTGLWGMCIWMCVWMFVGVYECVRMCVCVSTRKDVCKRVCTECILKTKPMHAGR
jgi:hypothetical protein